MVTGVAILLVALAAILIPLGVLGYLTPSSQSTSDNTACRLGVDFTQTASISGEGSTFGALCSADAQGRYVATIQASNFGSNITDSLVKVYENTGTAFNPIVSSSFQTSAAQVLKLVAMSSDGEYVAGGLAGLDNPSISTNGALHITTRNFETIQQFLRSDNEPAAIWFDREDDTKCYVGWNKLNVETITGAVVIYTRSGATWTATGTLSNPAAKAADGFGFAVHQNKNFLVASNVGTLLNASINKPAGVNYYRRTSTSGEWTYQGIVAPQNPSDAVPLITFGYQTVIHETGLWLFVSTPFTANVDDAKFNGGKVYAYYRASVEDQFPNNPHTVLDNPATNISSNFYGTALSLVGDYLFVAAGQQNESPKYVTYYLLDRSAGTLTRQGQINGPILGTTAGNNDAAEFGYQGFSATLADNVLRVTVGQNALATTGNGLLLAFESACT